MLDQSRRIHISIKHSMLVYHSNLSWLIYAESHLVLSPFTPYALGSFKQCGVSDKSLQLLAVF